MSDSRAGQPAQPQDLVDVESMSLAASGDTRLAVWAERWPGHLQIDPSDPPPWWTLWSVRVGPDGAPLGEPQELRRVAWSGPFVLRGLAGNEHGFLALYNGDGLFAAFQDRSLGLWRLANLML